MAATIEGVFRIIDRASPTMRAMERQALRTDLAIKKLGADLDKIGTPQQAKRVETLHRAYRTLGNESETVGRKQRGLERDLGRTEKRLRTQDSLSKRLSGTWKLLARDMMRLKFPVLAAGIGVAAQAIGALSGGVVGLLPRVVDLTGALAPAVAGITGIGLAAVTGKLAFSGMSQAMSGNAQAMRQMTPMARQFIREMRQFRPIMREFRQSAQGGTTGRSGVLGGMSVALKQLRADAPYINGILKTMSDRLGGLVRQGTRRFLGNQGFLRDFRGIAGQGGSIVTSMGTGLFNIVDALRHVAVAARPFTTWMNQLVVGWTRHLTVVAKNGRETGRLARFFDRTRVALTNMGHILRNVWVGMRELGQAARPLGDMLWRDAERATGSWARMLGTTKEQVSLTQRFISMEPAIRQIFGLVGDLGRAIFNMGANNNLARTVQNLRGIVGPLASLLNGLANSFGPGLANALTAVSRLVNDMSGAATPFGAVFTAVTGIANAFSMLARSGPVVRNIFATVFSTLLISRYAIKLGILEKGWWKVAFAARAAAAAEGVASVGVGGGAVLGARGRGIGGFFGRIGRFGRGRGGGAPVATAGTSGVFQSLTGTAARGAGLRGALMGGGLATAGRLGLGVASKFLLPIAAMQGLFGALTAGRSGSVGHQVAQSAFGGLNAITMGGLGGIGGLGNFFATPEQRAASQVAGDQSSLNRDLRQATQGKRGVASLVAELGILKRHSDDIDNRQTSAAQAYIAQLQAQTQAIRSNIAAIREEKAQRDAGHVPAVVASLNKVARTEGAGAAATAALQQINARTTSRGRGQLERIVLRGAYRQAMRTGDFSTYNRLAGGVRGILAAHGNANFQVARGRIFTGSRRELSTLNAALGLPDEVIREGKAQGPTNAQRNMISSMIAAGYSPMMARQIVLASEGSPTGISGFSSGGRFGGSGLRDTVPVGGMAAPGELIVNRHTENRINHMLGGRSTLGNEVRREGRPHSQSFATGGRTPSGLNFNGHPSNIQPGIANVARTVLGQFPGLSITSTTDGAGHAHDASGRPTSYHYKGMAVDIGGPQGTMDLAGAWVQRKLGAGLLEGIHNSSLSVKNGSIVGPGFWGADTWAGHVNHLHLAAAGGGAGAAAGASTGSGTGGNRVAAAGASASSGSTSPTLITQLQRQTSRLGGLGGINFGGSPSAAASSSGSGSTASSVSGGAGAGATGANQRVGRRLMMSMYPQWGAGEWPALRQLWTGESGWQNVMNKQGSGAGGIPQALPMSKMASAGADWKTNPATQIKWGLGYIAGRYGTPSKALNFWNSKSPHWYGEGMAPTTFDTPTLIGVGDKKETVSITPHHKKGGGGRGVNFYNTFHIAGGGPEVEAAVERALLKVAEAIDRHSYAGDEA